MCLLPSAEGDDDTSFSKDVLKERRPVFLDELEPTEVADYLFQFSVLDLDCHDTIEDTVLRINKIQLVLQYLDGKSPKCFNIFLHTLKLSNQQHILSMLQEREESTSMTPKRKGYGRTQALTHLSWKIKWAFLTVLCLASIFPSIHQLILPVCSFNCKHFTYVSFSSEPLGEFFTKFDRNHPWIFFFKNPNLKKPYDSKSWNSCYGRCILRN